MKIEHGASVYTRDKNEVGRVERVVIDPRSHEITHLVVGASVLFNDSRLIPIKMVANAEPGKIFLLSDQDSLEELAYFEETHYIPPDEAEDKDQAPGDYAPPLYWYPPVGMTSMGYPGYYAFAYPTQTEQNLPEELVALKDGAKVTDLFGEEIGEVEKVISEGDQDELTHIVVGWGLLPHNRKLIPAHWVEGVSENQVKLAVHKREVERLPEYEE